MSDQLTAKIVRSIAEDAYIEYMDGYPSDFLDIYPPLILRLVKEMWIAGYIYSASNPRLNLK